MIWSGVVAHTLLQFLIERQSPAQASLRSGPPLEVRWTVAEAARPTELARAWGVPLRRLATLNPGLDLEAPVPPGERLALYHAAWSGVARSVGTPSRGRLRDGIPLPEGEGWTLSHLRRRQFGSRTTVASLVAAFADYRRRYPDAPPVGVRDLSTPQGGRLVPHASHQSGRDVDIAYPLREGSSSDPGERATPETIDAERAWALVRALIDTGNVRSIFVSSRLQPALLHVARRELPAKRLASLFRAAAADPAATPLIRHVRGHQDHMHVRFHCAPDEPRCANDGY